MDDARRSPTELLSARIGDFIEPLTRFDRGDVAIAGAERRDVAVTARQAFGAVLRSETQAGNGALPADATAVDNAAERDRRIAQEIERGEAQARARLGQWAASHAAPPTSRPGVADCFTPAPAIGYSWTCTTCHGARQVTCGNCRGNGEIECPACNGAGEQMCWSCSGSGEQSCGTCSGRGTYWTQESRTVWNSASNSNVTEYYQVTHNCMSCGGRGKLNCTSCGAKGKVTCSNCGGSRRVRCGTCGGGGSVTCGDCGGEGAKHETKRVVCTIAERFEVEVGSGDAEIDAAIKGLASAEALVALAAPDMACTFASAGVNIVRTTAAHIAVSSATVGVGRQEVIIRGYGPEAQVYDFKNVAGFLLDADLDNLEAALANKNGLVAALADVLASEAHLVVVEHVADSGFDAAAFSAAQFKSAVSGDHVQRTALALKRGVTRAYTSELARGPGWTLLTPLPAVAIGMVGLNLPLWSLELPVLAAAATTGAGWLAHLAMVGRFAKLFQPLPRARAAKVLGSLKLTRNWWIAVAASATVGVFIAFQVAPPVMTALYMLLARGGG